MALFGPPNVDKLEKKKNINGLLKALDYTNKKDDHDWKIRLQAAEALGRIGSAEAGEPLARACGDPSPAVRLAAVQAIAKVAPYGGFARANAYELVRASLVAMLPGAVDIMQTLYPWIDAPAATAGKPPLNLPAGPLAIALGALVERYLNLTAGVRGFHFSSSSDRGLHNMISQESGAVTDLAIKIGDSGDAGYAPFLCCYLKQLQDRFGTAKAASDVLSSNSAIQYVRSALIRVSGSDYGDDVERYLARWRAHR